MTDTNIVRLRERLSEAMHATVPPAPAGGTDVQHGSAAGRKNRAFGTSAGLVRGHWIDCKVVPLGSAWAENVRNAYRFICANYDPNDKIFIFGFSRGAFTARSLAGDIAAAGIIKPEECTAANDFGPGIITGRSLGRACPASRTRSAKTRPPRENMIECLGVFDTVGSLGVPFRRFSRLNRAVYEFHDVVLSPISQFNLHALAIDEHRWPFASDAMAKVQVRRAPRQDRAGSVFGEP